jgi:phage I-like protein
MSHNLTYITALNHNLFMNAVNIRRFRGFVRVPVTASDGSISVPNEIQIMPVGSWIGSNHGDFILTEADLQLFVQNSNQNLRAGLPIDLEHKTDDGAVGWIEKLVNKGADGLWATVEWTKRGASLLADREYRFFSPEFYLDGYEDPETGQMFRNVLIGGALTNRPFFKNMTPLMASEHSTVSSLTDDTNPNTLFVEERNDADMNMLEELRSKPLDALAPEELKVLRDNESELTAEEKAKFGFVTEEVKEEVKTEEVVAEAKTEEIKEVAKTEEPAAEKVAEPVMAAEATTGKDDMVSIKASELDALKSTALKFLEKEAGDLVETHIARGAIKADEKTEYVSMLLEAPEGLRTKLEKRLENLPANELITAGEKGSTEKGAIGSASDQIQQKAEALMASDKTLDLGRAMSKVMAADKELADQFEAELTNA